METNPYAAPKPNPGSPGGQQSGPSQPDGRTVGAGRGWDWISEGFGMFGKQPGTWIVISIALGVILIVLAPIPLLGSLASALVFPIFGGGLMLGCKQIDAGGTLAFNHLFAGFKQNTSELFMVGLFNLVGWTFIVVIAIAVMGFGLVMGLLRGELVAMASIPITSILIAALLAAGLSLPLYMASWFAPALIVLQGMSSGAALKASFCACLKNILPFTVYGLVLMVLGVIAAIPLGLGYLVLGPVIVTSIYIGYRDIFTGGDAAAALIA